MFRICELLRFFTPQKMQTALLICHFYLTREYFQWAIKVLQPSQLKAIKVILSRYLVACYLFRSYTVDVLVL